jgi:hypothetical protein
MPRKALPGVSPGHWPFWKESTVGVRIITVAGVLLGVALCGFAATGAGDGGALTTAPTTRAALLPIRYERTGGIAGTRDVVEITPAGEVVVQGKMMKSGKGHLSPEGVPAMAALFAGWDTLQNNYPAPAGMRDGFTYKLRYGTREVTVGEGNPDAPAAFTAARQAVEEVAREAAK